MSTLKFFLFIVFSTFLGAVASSISTENFFQDSQLTYSVAKLKKEFGYPIYLCSYLLPSLLIDKNVDFEEWKMFVDEIVENDYGNSLRLFSAGCWEGRTLRHLRFPYDKIDGKFDLTKMNKKWKRQTLKRIKYFVDRGGVIIYTLIDGCSLPYHPESMTKTGYWRDHWWNGDNNINGTSAGANAIREMFRSDTLESRQTRKFVLEYMDTMVELLERKFPGSIAYDFNETPFYLNWYLEVKKRIFDKHDIPKHRRMFSWVQADYQTVCFLAKKYIWQIHGIGTLTDYYDYPHHPLQIHLSADGRKSASKHMAKKLTYEFMVREELLENNRPKKIGSWKRFPREMRWDEAEGMMQGFMKWYREQQ